MLEKRLPDQPDRLDRARRVCAQVDTWLQSESAEPSIAKPAALLAGVALAADGSGRDDDAPAGEQELLESGFVRELLAAAGIADQEAAKIEQLVHSIFSSLQHDGAELRLVRAAVQLVHGTGE